jgi:hypothetical protein
MSNKKVQLFINDKEMQYSHQNMVGAIKAWLPYLTTPDLNELTKKIDLMKNARSKNVEIL